MDLPRMPGRLAFVAVASFFVAVLQASALPHESKTLGVLLAGIRGNDWDIPLPPDVDVSTAKTSPIGTSTTLSQAQFEKILRHAQQYGAKSNISSKGASMLALCRPGQDWPARQVGLSDQDGVHFVHVGNDDSNQIVFSLISGDRFTLFRVDRGMTLVSALRWIKGSDAEPVLLDSAEGQAGLKKELAFWAKTVEEPGS